MPFNPSPRSDAARSAARHWDGVAALAELSWELSEGASGGALQARLAPLWLSAVQRQATATQQAGGSLLHAGIALWLLGGSPHPACRAAAAGLEPLLREALEAAGVKKASSRELLDAMRRGPAAAAAAPISLLRGAASAASGVATAHMTLASAACPPLRAGVRDAARRVLLLMRPAWPPRGAGEEGAPGAGAEREALLGAAPAAAAPGGCELVGSWNLRAYDSQWHGLPHCLRSKAALLAEMARARGLSALALQEVPLAPAHLAELMLQLRSHAVFAGWAMASAPVSALERVLFAWDARAWAAQGEVRLFPRGEAPPPAAGARAGAAAAGAGARLAPAAAAAAAAEARVARAAGVGAGLSPADVGLGAAPAAAGEAPALAAVGAAVGAPAPVAAAAPPPSAAAATAAIAAARGVFARADSRVPALILLRRIEASPAPGEPLSAAPAAAAPARRGLLSLPSAPPPPRIPAPAAPASGALLALCSVHLKSRDGRAAMRVTCAEVAALGGVCQWALREAAAAAPGEGEPSLLLLGDFNAASDGASAAARCSLPEARARRRSMHPTPPHPLQPSPPRTRSPPSTPRAGARSVRRAACPPRGSAPPTFLSLTARGRPRRARSLTMHG